MSKTAKIREMLRRKCSVQTISEKLKVTPKYVRETRWKMGKTKRKYTKRVKAEAEVKTDSVGVEAFLKMYQHFDAKVKATIAAMKALGY